MTFTLRSNCTTVILTFQPFQLHSELHKLAMWFAVPVSHNPLSTVTSSVTVPIDAKLYEHVRFALALTWCKLH